MAMMEEGGDFEDNNQGQKRNTTILFYFLKKE